MPASKAQRAATAERRKQAVQMRLGGATFDTIATQLGYASKAAAYMDIKRAMESAILENRQTVEVYREEELQRLDALLVEAWAVLKRAHVTVSHGKLIYDDRTGEPLLDDGPTLSAIDRVLKIQERRAKFLGLDAPTKHEVVTMDAVNAEIARLSAELGLDQAGPAAGAAAAPAAPTTTG